MPSGVEPTGGSRLAQTRIVRPRRLSPVAHPDRPAGVRSLCEHEKEHGLKTLDKLVPYSAGCGAMPVGSVHLASGLAVGCHHRAYLSLSCAGCMDPD